MQLLTESILLGLLRGVTGLAVSAVSLYVVEKIHPGNIPRLDELRMNYQVFPQFVTN